MSFGAKKEDVREFKASVYITYGVQVLKINDIQIEYSAQKNTPRLKFIVESELVTEAGFVADPSALSGGKVGTIRSGWLATDDQKTELSKNMIFIARAILKSDETPLDGYFAETLEQYIEKVKSVICGKFTNFSVGAEEYLKTDGKKGISLKFLRFGFVSSDINKLKFDKENEYHYKKLTVIPDKEIELPDYTEEEAKDLVF